MNIAVDAKNFFYLGWVAALLGLPRGHPAENALKSGDVAAFNDGWDMCVETPRTEAIKVLDQERRLCNVSIVWVNDENEEV